MVGQKTNVTRFGGIERHVGLLADRLAERGHQVTVFTRRRYGDPVRPADGVSLVRRPSVPSKHLEAITHSTLCSLECASSMPPLRRRLRPWPSCRLVLSCRLRVRYSTI